MEIPLNRTDPEIKDFNYVVFSQRNKESVKLSLKNWSRFLTYSESPPVVSLSKAVTFMNAQMDAKTLTKIQAHILKILSIGLIPDELEVKGYKYSAIEFLELSMGMIGIQSFSSRLIKLTMSLNVDNYPEFEMVEPLIYHLDMALKKFPLSINMLPYDLKNMFLTIHKLHGLESLATFLDSNTLSEDVIFRWAHMYELEKRPLTTYIRNFINFSPIYLTSLIIRPKELNLVEKTREKEYAKKILEEFTKNKDIILGYHPHNPSFNFGVTIYRNTPLEKWYIDPVFTSIYYKLKPETCISIPKKDIVVPFSIATGNILPSFFFNFDSHMEKNEISTHFKKIVDYENGENKDETSSLTQIGVQSGNYIHKTSLVLPQTKVTNESLEFESRKDTKVKPKNSKEPLIRIKRVYGSKSKDIENIETQGSQISEIRIGSVRNNKDKNEAILTNKQMKKGKIMKRTSCCRKTLDIDFRKYPEFRSGFFIHRKCNDKKCTNNEQIKPLSIIVVQHSLTNM